MCRRINCTTCHRPTFAGCGAHVAQVLADVAPSERCRCRKASEMASDPQPQDKPLAVRQK